MSNNETPTVFCDGCGEELDWNSEAKPVQLIEGGNYHRFHNYTCVTSWAEAQEPTADTWNEDKGK